MIRVELETLSPLHVADGHTPGPLSKTLPYIPGRTMRGVLAEKYLMQNTADAQFEAYFLAEGSWFGPLNPVGSIGGGETFVLPATAASCKAYGGFRPDAGVRHGVRDMLLEYLQPDGAQFNDACAASNCGAGLVPYSAFYRHGQRYETVEVPRRFMTRTALDSRRETAAQAQLFTLEVIEEAQRFVGWIALATEAHEQTFVDGLLAEGSELRIGRARTRGLGRMQVVSAGAAAGRRSSLWLTEGGMAERIMAFHDLALQRGVEVPDGHILFTVTFLSDGVVRDRYLRCTTDLSADILARGVDARLAQALPLRAIVKNKRLEGWQAMHGLPRDTALAIEAGSVYTYTSPLALVELADALAHVERTGFGEWRNDGYGRVIIGHPFHRQEGQI